MAGGVTSAGKAIITNVLNGSTWYLEVGTGTTTYSASQTALVSAITDSGLARAAATSSRVTTTVTNDTLRLTKTWTASGSKTIAECGVFDTAVSGGNMLGRDKLDASKSVTSGDSFTATIDVPFS